MVLICPVITIKMSHCKVRELDTAQLATVRPQDVRLLSLQDFLRFVIFLLGAVWIDLIPFCNHGDERLSQ